MHSILLKCFVFCCVNSCAMVDKSDIEKPLYFQNIFILTKRVVNILLFNFLFLFFSLSSKPKNLILQALFCIVCFTDFSYFWCTSNIADYVPLSSFLIIRSSSRGKSCSFKCSTIIFNRKVYAWIIASGIDAGYFSLTWLKAKLLFKLLFIVLELILHWSSA